MHAAAWPISETVRCITNIAMTFLEYEVLPCQEKVDTQFLPIWLMLQRGDGHNGGNV